jgi:hypothetical protein
MVPHKEPNSVRRSATLTVPELEQSKTGRTQFARLCALRLCPSVPWRCRMNRKESRPHTHGCASRGFLTALEARAA